MSNPQNPAESTRKPDSYAWLLSRDPYQRLCLRYWLLTSRLYLILVTLQLVAVSLGMMEPRYAVLIGGMASTGIAMFYVAIRSGWSKRLPDPALTVYQVAFGLVVLAVDYAAAPLLQSMILTVTPLGLMFGAFTLTPRQCRALGVVSVATLGAGMLLGSHLHPESSNAQRDLIILLACAAVYNMVATMSGRLSAMRNQLRVQKRELAEALERNNLLARRDELTGLPNRRHALEMMAYEERRAAREAVRPSVCVLDIDHFKAVNDTYGHPAGDDVLRLVARNAPNALRTPDLLARWGGEEFLLVMPQTAAETAVLVIERLRVALAQPHLWIAHPHLQVTFSAGVAIQREGESMEVTVARADAALYKAKQAGRNCTVSAEV